MRVVTVDPNACVACRDCEYACAFEHGGGFSRSASYVRVNFYPAERACIPLTCLHCEEAWCLEICPAGAISRDEHSGAVQIDQSRCAGCKMCILACPLGNIHFDAEEGVSGKCDLCGGDPACVRSCTSHALRYMEADEAADASRETLDACLNRVLHVKREGC
jgi:anaerobic carbon-monoxide dehydrogenase iron sulfur subunit